MKVKRQISTLKNKWKGKMKCLIRCDGKSFNTFYSQVIQRFNTFYSQSPNYTQQSQEEKEIQTEQKYERCCDLQWEDRELFFPKIRWKNCQGCINGSFQREDFCPRSHLLALCLQMSFGILRLSEHLGSCFQICIQATTFVFKLKKVRIIQ